MSRRNLIIVAIVTSVVLLLAIIVVVSIQSSQPSEGDETSQNTEEGAVEASMGDHDKSAGDHEHGEEIIVAGRELEPEDINDDIVPLARRAVTEYVRQSTSESSSERRSRLAPLFTPNSSSVTAPKPSVDKSHSPNTNSEPIVLSDQWEMDGNSLIVTVFVEVVTISRDEPYNEVSRVTQGYDVVMVAHRDSYRAQSIKFSDKPIIRRE